MLALTGLPVATLADLAVLHVPVTWAHLEGLIAAMAGATMVIVSVNREERSSVGEEAGPGPTVS